MPNIERIWRKLEEEIEEENSPNYKTKETDIEKQISELTQEQAKLGLKIATLREELKNESFVDKLKRKFNI